MVLPIIFHVLIPFGKEGEKTILWHTIMQWVSHQRNTQAGNLDASVWPTLLSFASFSANNCYYFFPPNWPQVRHFLSITSPLTSSCLHCFLMILRPFLLLQSPCMCPQLSSLIKVWSGHCSEEIIMDPYHLDNHISFPLPNCQVHPLLGLTLLSNPIFFFFPKCKI